MVLFFIVHGKQSFFVGAKIRTMNYKMIVFFFYLSGICFTLQAEQLEDKLNVYYYSSVEFVETPLSYLKGSVPLSKEVALGRNHYRFTYDDKHRLKSITFFNGDTPRNPNHTSNLFTLAHRLVFSYEDAIETISFYDVKDNQIEVLGNCYRFVYTLNPLGFRESLYFENVNGERTENSWNIYQYQWIYESDGAVIEDRFNKAGEQMPIRPGFEFHRLRLYFNPLGHIALMQNIDQEGNLIENTSGAAQDQITTNAAGNFLKWEVLDKTGQLEKGNGPDVAIGIQTFNEYGYESKLEHRDENNQLIYNSYGICSSETRFDKWGNIKERRFYDDRGKPTHHEKAGYFQLKLQWDITGNFRDNLAYYDIKGQAASHQERGYHKVLYKYDDEQRLIQISYHDAKEQLVNRKDNGIAYIQYEYDSNGALLKTTRYNKNHKVLEH